MKSYNHLFEKIIAHDNLERAIIKSAKGKHKRPDVKWALSHKEQVISKITYLLITETWEIRHHTPKEIYDGISRKKRKIVQPDYLYEQIIHHAIIQVIGPILLNRMYKYSCGSIPKRGGYYAKRHLERFIKRHPKEVQYIMQADVYHFFPSISHKVLKQKLADLFHDEKLLRLLYKIIDSYHDEPGYGIPIGYYTSQWFANFYLQEFDYYIKQKLGFKLYQRYMDDLVFSSHLRQKLSYCLIQIKSFLKNRLDLRLKPNYQIFLFDNQEQEPKYRKPLSFVGFLFYKTKTILRKKIMVKAVRKAYHIYNKQIKAKVKWIDASQMLSWLSWFKRTNTYNCYKQYIKPFINIKYLKFLLSRRSKSKNWRLAYV